MCLLKLSIKRLHDQLLPSVHSNICWFISKGILDSTTYPLSEMGIWQNYIKLLLCKYGFISYLVTLMTWSSLVTQNKVFSRVRKHELYVICHQVRRSMSTIGPQGLHTVTVQLYSLRHLVFKTLIILTYCSPLFIFRFLSGNNIHTIDPEAFSGLKSLKYLWVPFEVEALAWNDNWLANYETQRKVETFCSCEYLQITNLFLLLFVCK